MTDLDGDRIYQLVKDAAPAARLGPDAEVATLLRTLAMDVIDDQPAKARSGITDVISRWRRLLVAPLAAGAVLLTAAAGFAVWHDSDSEEFEQALTQYTSEVVLPPGTDRAAYVALVRAQGKELRASVADADVKSMASHYAVCAWLTAWDRRHAAGDDVGEAEALTAVRRAIAVPSITANDGGGVVANLQRVADAAAHGDRSAVTRELKNNCSDLPLDGAR